MVQELHVLRCFSCNTFQSHIVKKTNKWECKICGVKQSIKKVYGRGSGKDCRIHTQKLNILKGQKEETECSSEHAKESYLPDESSVQQLRINEPSSLASPKPEVKRRKSKWADFINENEAAVYQNHFTKQENISSTPNESFKNSVQKRKIRDTFGSKELGGYSDDFDSVDMNYFSSNNMCPSAHTKKTRFNNCHISINNRSNKIDSDNCNGKIISRTSINTQYADFSIGFKTESGSKTSEKSGDSKKNEIRKPPLVSSLNTNNNFHKNTKTSFKWGKYLDEVEDVITKTTVQSESECDLNSGLCLKNTDEENKGSCFKVDNNFGHVPFYDYDIIPSNEFNRMSSDGFERKSSRAFEGKFSGHLISSNETMSIKNTVPNFSTSKESINNCVYDLKKKLGDNYKMRFFFDPETKEPTNKSIDETVKYKFTKGDDNEVELSRRQEELSICKTIPSLPVFEQNCELSDMDFQLDF